jgi:hypothetical protein
MIFQRLFENRFDPQRRSDAPSPRLIQFVTSFRSAAPGSRLAADAAPDPIGTSDRGLRNSLDVAVKSPGNNHNSISNVAP